MKFQLAVIYQAIMMCKIERGQILLIPCVKAGPRMPGNLRAHNYVTCGVFTENGNAIHVNQQSKRLNTALRCE